MTPEIDGRAILRRELRANGPSPMLEALVNDGWTETGRRRPARRRDQMRRETRCRLCGSEGQAEEFPLDEVMAVEARELHRNWKGAFEGTAP